MRIRYALVLVVVAAAAALAGCGGGGSSGSDPATLAPRDSPVFIEATLKPEGEAREDLEGMASQIAGIDDLGATIVESIESSALSSEAPLDFEKEIEPWLGERAGLFLERYDGQDFQGGGAMVEATDTGAAQSFVEERIEGEGGGEPQTYEGVEYFLEPDGEEAVGLIGDFLAFGQDEDSFKAMVDASDGESLADQDSYGEASSEVPSGSVANLYADIGGLISQAGGQIDAETQAFLATAGLNPREATAELSLVPGANRIEIDISSDVIPGKPAGDSSKLLESLPGSSFAAFVSADFGARFKEAIDRLDSEGIAGEVEPGELKKGLEEAGIDLDQIGSSIGDLGVFLQGDTSQNLVGAVVLTATNETEARNTVSNLGLLLRKSGTPGVTAISGELAGFSVRTGSLDEPIVVAAKGERIAIATGLAAATEALATGEAATLGSNPEFAEAVAALGDTPISGFIDGPAALRFASDLAGSTEESGQFESAKSYLEKVAYIAIGSGNSDDRTTARLIVGLTE